MKSIRQRLSAFYLRNWNKGIHNLMLYIAIGNVIVYFISLIDPSGLVLDALYFDPTRILQGQVWRLFTVVFLHITYSSQRLLAAIFIISYVWIGRYAEQLWGACKFTIYYFGCLILMDAVALAAGCTFLPNWMHMTLFLIFAVAAPTAQIRLWGILPLRAKYLAWLDIGLTLYDVVGSLLRLPSVFYQLTALWVQIVFPLIPIVYFLLFVGKDAKNLLPDYFTRTKTQKSFRNYQNQRRARERANPNWADGYRSSTGEKPYRHKCTVCGRTDVTNPELEFRYCSKCNGYYCYCMDHINNHVHIQ